MGNPLAMYEYGVQNSSHSPVMWFFLWSTIDGEWSRNHFNLHCPKIDEVEAIWRNFQDRIHLAHGFRKCGALPSELPHSRRPGSIPHAVWHSKPTLRKWAFISDIETELWVVEMMHFDAFCSLPAIFNPAHIFQQLSWYACCCYSCSWDKVPLCSASWSISTHRGCLQCCYFWAFGWCRHVSSHSGSVCRTWQNLAARHTISPGAALTPSGNLWFWG